MASKRSLLDLYLPPENDYVLESLIATSYEVNWGFVEEDLLPAALGVRSPTARMNFFRSEFERRLESCDVSILYDLRAARRNASRSSPRIDALPVSGRKLHAKVTLLLWSKVQATSGRARKVVRLIIGSANLTRQGFRENHEVATALDFSERGSPHHALLESVLDLILKVAGEVKPKQLVQQISAFRHAIEQIPRIKASDGEPKWLVGADAVISKLSDGWKALARGAPEAILIASPFWPSGGNVADPIISLVKRVGLPKRIELICGSNFGLQGTGLLPVIPSELPRQLKVALKCQVVVRPSNPIYGTVGAGVKQDDELTEGNSLVPESVQQTERHRDLHAKVIAIYRRQRCALYIGSSNYTRPGLGLPQAGGGTTGKSNWEAGMIYLLRKRSQSIVKQITAFAGSAIEVPPDGRIPTKEPEHEPDPPSPTFLREIVVEGVKIVIRFQETADIPTDLSILMPDPVQPGRYFLLVRTKPADIPPRTVELFFNDCAYVNEALEAVVAGNSPPSIENICSWVEVRWQGECAYFPVRFEEKTTLPRVRGARKATERELLEYFLFGREPWIGDRGDGPAGPSTADGPEDPVDTRSILSYLIRTFVEAIPGLEAQILCTLHSEPALRAALFGPTSVIEVANRANESLRDQPARGEPKKTPVSVSFQLIEIIAMLRRCKDKTSTLGTSALITKAIECCQESLKSLIADFPQLHQTTLEEYSRLFNAE